MSETEWREERESIVGDDRKRRQEEDKGTMGQIANVTNKRRERERERERERIQD